MQYDYIFSNRVLVGDLKDTLEREPTTIDLTFTRTDLQKLISKFEPVANKDKVAPVYIFEIHDLMFLVQQPEEFAELDLEDYAAHFDWLFSEISLEDNSFELIDLIEDEGNELELYRDQNFDQNVEYEEDGKDYLLSIAMFRSRNPEDDRCVIVTDKYDPNLDKSFLNFLQGEEITTIDIDKTQTIL